MKAPTARWLVVTVIGLIAAGSGGTAWLNFAKENHYWPFRSSVGGPHVTIKRVTITQNGGIPIDLPMYVIPSVNGQAFSYPKLPGPPIPASQIREVQIPVIPATGYYVTVSGSSALFSEDHFFFPSHDIPFSHIVTAHLFGVQINPKDPKLAATVEFTVEDK